MHNLPLNVDVIILIRKTIIKLFFSLTVELGTYSAQCVLTIMTICKKMCNCQDLEWHLAGL